MSGGTPRKFSEKIAIMERKQTEDVSQFEDIMREVRSITTDNASPGGLLPPAWPQLGGSLPNVTQLPSYSQGWQQWDVPPQQQTHPSAGAAPRGRSPDHHQHFHPYRGGQRSPDRVPPLHPYAYAPQHTLQPPDQWNQMNRARSDPAIHQIHPMHPMMQQQIQMQQHQQHMQQQYMQMQAGPSGIHPDAMQQQQMMNQQHYQQQQQQQQMGQHPQQGSMGGMVGGPPSNQHQMVNTSPLQSPMGGHMLHGYQYPNGSPMQSPLSSPMGSSMMLDDRTTPMMELSPPGMMHDQNSEIGSLPNLPQQHQQQQPPTCYHATVGQRHSTGQCGRLVPGPVLTPESQSAPTSPANTLDPTMQPQWPAARTFSNSPESMDIPRVVLTNPDGAHGPHMECFNDLQHLTLDSNEIALMSNGDGYS